MSIILFLILTFFSVPALAQSADNAILPQTSQSVPLAPDSNSELTSQNSERSSRSAGILPTMGAIVIVAGAFLLLLWLLKKSEGNSGRNLPDSVVKTLGKTRIGSFPVFLVAVGKKLVLVAVSSNGLTPLTEIDDPAEADFIQKALSGENRGGK